MFLSQQDLFNTSGYRFRKSDLNSAQVIQQVDRKFIACMIQREAPSPGAGDNDPALVLVDQHAADERVRVEKYLKDLCLGFLRNLAGERDADEYLPMKDLSPGMPVLLTTHEASRLAGSLEIQSAFSNWGIRFEGLGQMRNLPISGERGEDSSGYTQVLARTIPEVVSDKVFPVIRSKGSR